MKTRHFIYAITILLVAVLISIIACNSDQKDELLNIEHQQIEFRGSGGILELLGKDCIPDSLLNITQYCNSTEYFDTITIDSVSGYPGCTFTVVVSYYLCSWMGLMDVRSSDYQILEHDCEKFSDDLDSLPYDPTFSYIIDFDALIYEKIEEYFMNKFMSGGTYPCGSGAVFNIIFYRSSCYKYCVSEEEWGRGRVLQTIYKIGCGDQCCERRTYMCENPDGSIYTNTSYQAPVYPTCDQQNVGSLDCYGSNVVWESDCEFTCQ